MWWSELRSLFFEPNHTPSGRINNGDLNVGGLNTDGQISLSYHKKSLKLTH